MTYGGAYNGTTSLGAATATVVVSENPLRRRITICNVGGNVAYIALGPTPTASYGIYLSANGGSLLLEADTYGYMYKGIITAISTAGSTLSYCEEPGYIRS